MNNSNNGNDDFSFGFSDGWLGGTGTDSGSGSGFAGNNGGYGNNNDSIGNRSGYGSDPSNGSRIGYISGETIVKKKVRPKKIIPKATKLLIAAWLIVMLITTVVMRIVNEDWFIPAAFLSIVAGIMTFIFAMPESKTKAFVIFLVIDAVVIAILTALRSTFPTQFSLISWDKALEISLSSIFMIVGLGVSLGTIFLTMQKKRICTKEIKAKCFSVSWHRRRNSRSRGSTIVYTPHVRVFL